MRNFDKNHVCSCYLETEQCARSDSPTCQCKCGKTWVKRNHRRKPRRRVNTRMKNWA